MPTTTISPSVQNDINSLDTIFGQGTGPSIASESIDYCTRKAQLKILAKGLPGIVTADENALAAANAAIKANPVNTPASNGQIATQQAADLAYDAASHAAAWDLPTFSNVLKGWYQTWGILPVNTTQKVEPVPALPADLAPFLQQIVAANRPATSV
jgi:hypothetical protein